MKLFGKRVKGTEQFWSVEGAEAILALRSKWLRSGFRTSHALFYAAILPCGFSD